MTKLFLLTAPFDEEAKTGDGQYALSLEWGLKNFYGEKLTQCKWLKEANGDYSLPTITGLLPYPPKTIPSAYVLQPVANEKTTSSGYKVTGTEKDAGIANEINSITVSPKTPKVLLDESGKLQELTVMDCYTRKPTTFTTDSINKLIETIANKVALANKFAQTYEDMPKKLKSKKRYLDEKYQTYEHNNLLSKEEFFEANLNKKAFDKRVKDAIDELTHIKNQFGKLVDERKLLAAIDKITGVSSYQANLDSGCLAYGLEEKNISDIFDYAQLEKSITDIIEKIDQKLTLKADPQLQQLRKEYHELKQNVLSPTTSPKALLKDLELLVTNRSEINREYSALLPSYFGKIKFSAKDLFHMAYESNQQDPTKKSVIDDLIRSMKPIDEETVLDIHIRPPDTGVFITPKDIKRIQSHGIKVNITVHEYKQNYTRRYLQQYTHDLLREADSVLFFNERDRDNACYAAKHGDCDRRNTDPVKRKAEVGDKELETYPVDPYDLQSKSGLTVASQKLSSVPKDWRDILDKEPNILSFGTIRPGKGFEEALSLAQCIREDNLSIKQKIGKVPVVILAGDPQNRKLMQSIVEERFGKNAVELYQQQNGFDKRFSNQQKRDYWKKLVNTLNKTKQLHNPYIEIHPWCEPYELEELKDRCKYVCRMDDMGMRNNGSAIISVLDVGIVYSKFGAVTDDIYCKGGKYGNAVDIGEHRYGVYNLEQQQLAGLEKENKARAKRDLKPLTLEEYNEQNPPLRSNPDSTYKRRSGSRKPEDILGSILAREYDQICQAEKGVITESQNYKTVIEAQDLLSNHFTIKNSVDNLLRITGNKKLIEPEKETTEEVVDVFSPLQEITEAIAEFEHETGQEQTTEDSEIVGDKAKNLEAENQANIALEAMQNGKFEPTPNIVNRLVKSIAQFFINAKDVLTDTFARVGRAIAGIVC